MAINSLYANKLKGLLQDPGSFSMTPGAQFAADMGMQAASRKYAAQGMGGSGNVLAELARLGTGYASQAYGDERDFLGKMVGQEQTFGLGEEANRLTGLRDTNQYNLGVQQNSINRLRADNDFTLGQGQNANTATANANNLTLGLGQNANTAQRNAWDHELGQGQNQNQANANTNTGLNNWWNYQLGQGRNENDRRQGDQTFGANMYRAGNDAQNNFWNAQNNAWSNWNTGNQNWWQNQNNQFANNTNRGTAIANAYSRWT